MKEALRQLMLRAPGSGELAGDSLQRGRAEHPVCGDVLELSWREEGGVVAELAWRAKGCPATLAVAAAAHEALVGRPRREAKDALARRLSDLGGLERHERHAERMVLEALGEERR